MAFYEKMTVRNFFKENSYRCDIFNLLRNVPISDGKNSDY